MSWTVLLVDDEPNVLDSLALALHRYRKTFSVHTANGGAQALEKLAAQEFDVVVSDVRMPAMDGVELLGRVRETFPDVIRLVLTGQATESTYSRLPDVAHHVLHKPCPPEHLVDVMRNACEVRALLADPDLRRTVGSVGQLPSFPDVCRDLTRLLAQSEPSPREVAATLETDPALAMKVLHTVNAGFFGLTRQVTSLRVAVDFLGATLVRDIVLSTAVLEMFQDGGSGLDLEALRLHGLLTGRVAHSFLDETQSERAFLAGLVHNVGLLLLNDRLPQGVHAALAEAAEREWPLSTTVVVRFGTSQAEIGAYLLGLWGFDMSIVRVVANLHRGTRDIGAGTDAELHAAVHVASVLAHEIHPLDFGGRDIQSFRLDPACAAATGLSDAPDEVRERVRSIAEESGIVNQLLRG